MNKWKVCCILILLLLCVFQRSSLYEGLEGDEIDEDGETVMDEESMPTGSMPTGSMPTGSMKTATQDIVSLTTKTETFQDYRIMPSDMCNDSTSWYALDRGNKKHYCEDVGKTASCYDYGVDGRDAWEACKNKCGNCINTQITKLPMNVMATFSGDPIEDFGVVLGIDSERDWVGNDDNSRTMNDGMADDIASIYDELKSLQNFTNLIMGNVKQCYNDRNTCPTNKFKGCDNVCLTCPSSLPSPTETNTYIKQVCEDDSNSNCSIQFPGIDISCNVVDNIFPSPPTMDIEKFKKKECSQYYLFDKIGDDDDDDKIIDTDKRMTLTDMCPYQCGVTACTN